MSFTYEPADEEKKAISTNGEGIPQSGTMIVLSDHPPEEVDIS